MAEARLLLLTCEHGGNRVPPRYRPLFTGQEELLAGHRGWDPGALALARPLARALGAPLFCSVTTRLLVDLNRSPGHRGRFSALTRDLPAPERQHLLRRYYRPYRGRVEKHVAGTVARGTTVVHIAIHTFTPELDGRTREVDVGLLYDPSRAPERDLCAAWQAALARIAPELRVRRNHPYRGVADGLPTWLRKFNRMDRYLGIELEVNQALAVGPAPRRRRLESVLATSLRSCLT